ncbi:hypothetical protein J4479_02675 [Candidatus Woesearchaeota archaeon]|nr:hypothetical protein [Candidatus Woesearchaeota archaeon]
MAKQKSFNRLNKQQIGIFIVVIVAVSIGTVVVLKGGGTEGNVAGEAIQFGSAPVNVVKETHNIRLFVSRLGFTDPKTGTPVALDGQVDGSVLETTDSDLTNVQTLDNGINFKRKRAFHNDQQQSIRMTGVEIGLSNICGKASGIYYDISSLRFENNPSTNHLQIIKRDVIQGVIFSSVYDSFPSGQEARVTLDDGVQVVLNSITNRASRASFSLTLTCP